MSFVLSLMFRSVTSVTDAFWRNVIVLQKNSTNSQLVRREVMEGVLLSLLKGENDF